MIKKCTLFLIVLFSVFFCNAQKRGGQVEVEPIEKDEAIHIGKYKALVVGTDNYDDATEWGHLTNPKFDAETIARTLKNDFGYDVTLLIDPTKHEILTSLSQLQQYFQNEIGNNTNLLIFIAGHGGYDINNPGYIVPKDAKNSSIDLDKESYIYQSVLRDKIQTIKAYHKLVILDVCFGGTFDQRIALRSDNTNADDEYADKSPEELQNEYLGIKSSKYITSGGKHYVPDGEEGKHSPFAKRIIDELLRCSAKKIPVTFDGFCASLKKSKSQPCAGDFGENDPNSDFILVPNSMKQKSTNSILTKSLTVEVNNSNLQPALEQRGVTKMETSGGRLVGDNYNTAPGNTMVKTTVEPEMVFVQGGSFVMGDNNSPYAIEKPAHRVTVSSFKIGKYPVTQAQWAAVMGSNPSLHKGCDNCPVEHLSGIDVDMYLVKLNKLTGKHYRWPTEAEYEYAERGGKQSHNYIYSGGNDLEAVAWYAGNSGDSTHPVGQKQGNELALYDMTGNVEVWCSDMYQATYYAHSTAKDPKGPGGVYRIIRGSSCRDLPLMSRVTTRQYETDADGWRGIGFRLVAPL